MPLVQFGYGVYKTIMLASLSILLLLVGMSVIIVLVHKACDWIEVLLINILNNKRKR